MVYFLSASQTKLGASNFYAFIYFSLCVVVYKYLILFGKRLAILCSFLDTGLDSLTAAPPERDTQHIHIMKHYKTYQARNAAKAAQVTNYIKKAKKTGKTHQEAKNEAHALFNIKRTK